nr:right-handed parallel beta-helix repeat-containing protein [Lachnospiraceae bacterium]
SQYYRGDFYDYYDYFFLVRYYYLLSPDLLMCFEAPKMDGRLTGLEIVNDYDMVSGIMEARMACKELDREEYYQPKKCLRFLMETMKDKKITGIQSDKVRFIKTEIENCSIEGIEAEDTEFRDCVFRNVTFDSHFETGYVSIERCTFINCVLHDTFGDIYFHLTDCLFQNCLFEGIHMEKEEGILNANRNKFLDCIFREIICKGEGGIFLCEIKRGSMEHIFYKTDDISRNKFSDIQMEHVYVEIVDEGLGFFDNQLNAVIFRNTTLKGSMEDNHLINCNTDGLTLI